MSRLAGRIKRLEGARGPCAACGGAGGLRVVIGDDPFPPIVACARCGRGPLIINVVEITEEEWREQQVARRPYQAA